MPRRPASVTQADIARALRAVKAAGVRATVRVTPDGTILIEPAEREAKPAHIAQTREIVL